MIDWWQAIWAGAAGGAAMIAVMTMARKALGLPVASMPRYEGGIITGSNKGIASMAAGLMMHLIVSALIAPFYAWAFAEISGRATWRLGIIAGLVHWLIAGFIVPLMDRMNPCVQDGRIQAFGLFGSNYSGSMVVGYLIGHLVYGAVVGWLYKVPGV